MRDSPGASVDVDRVRADRVPAGRDRVRRTCPRAGRSPRRGRCRRRRTCRGRCRSPSARRVHAVDGVVVAALAVLGLVVDRRPVRAVLLDLDLADRQVALVVGLVVLRVPQAELDEREERDRLRRVGRVGDRDLLDLGGLAEGHEEQRLDGEPAALARDARVAQAVARLEVVEVRLDRQPRRGPHVAAVVDVEVPAARVGGDVVVAVAREAAHLGVAVERVAARLVRDEREELLGAQVVDPRVRRVRRRDDVLACVVVEVAVPHGLAPRVLGSGARRSSTSPAAVRVVRRGSGAISVVRERSHASPGREHSRPARLVERARGPTRRKPSSAPVPLRRRGRCALTRGRGAGPGRRRRPCRRPGGAASSVPRPPATSRRAGRAATRAGRCRRSATRRPVPRGRRATVRTPQAAERSTTRSGERRRPRAPTVSAWAGPPPRSTPATGTASTQTARASAVAVTATSQTGIGTGHERSPDVEVDDDSRPAVAPGRASASSAGGRGVGPLLWSVVGRAGRVPTLAA